MSNITDIKFVLTQKGLDTFFHKFHILESVHSQLPSRNQTMHERPVGKIGVYTRFFKYVNFRLPLSTFLVDVLRYFRINLSQLSVIAAAKVSHFEILRRVYNAEPTVGLFRCFYVNSKNKGWMSLVNVLIIPPDPLPKSTEFNLDDYVVLVAHPAPFWKFPEPFLCLVGMSLYYTLDEDTYLRDGKPSLLITCPSHIVFSYMPNGLSSFVYGFNVGTARQACLNAEVIMRTEYCLSEWKRLESECKKQADLLKAINGEIEKLKAQLLLKEVEATKAVHLRI
nr:hypothetical protein [Tanacetum cinerariifolium]